MKISDTVVGAGFVFAGALIIAGTAGYPSLDGGHPGPSLFPRILGALMAAFGGLVSVKGLRSQDASEDVDLLHLYRNPSFINAMFVLAGVTAYILFVEKLGFLLMGALLLFVVMWRLKVHPLKALIVAVVFNTVVDFLFAKIMRVPLALGLLWW
jgi:putative tricarboxylic transport membrane protein